MKKSLISILLGSSLMAFIGCTSAQQAGMTAAFHNYAVTLYSGSQAVRTWHTKGMPHSEGGSDGYYFVDRDTRKLTCVSGTVVFEQE